MVRTERTQTIGRKNPNYTSNRRIQFPRVQRQTIQGQQQENRAKTSY